MPKNFSRGKINYLKAKDYIVLEKSDGVRYVVLLGKQKSFLLDRNLCTHKTPEREMHVQNGGTILDGELSLNMVKQAYEYLIYDIFALEGDWRISTWDLAGRIVIINKLKQKNLILGNWLQKFLQKKDFFAKTDIQKLFSKIQTDFFLNDHLYINQVRNGGILCNKNDGLILVLSKTVYFTKHPNSIFKWKYSKGNSIDFMVNREIKKEPVKGSCFIQSKLLCQNLKKNILNVLTRKKLFYSTASCFSRILLRRQQIEEFDFNRQKGKWSVSKKRPDKQNSNSVKVVLHTIENIAETMDKNELIDRCIKQSLREIRCKIILYQQY